MASVALREQLNQLLTSMFTEGLLDQQFQQLQMLQDSGSPGFVAEVITLFCEDSERILTELTKVLEQTIVDYQKLDAYVHQLKGSSSSVGAQNVKFACVQFRQFCEENNKEGMEVLLSLLICLRASTNDDSNDFLTRCIQALNVVKHEYYHLRNKFEKMLQLEQRIQAYDSKQQN
ncbi:histidine-containing phosphotransfer protein 2-like isoform X1 [Typha latifolia]|uniref:histidine-containing phosphotransfer protein 2-like isoform X1 n=1 Tax=Typha latifolia TaxID=4733 RepID=UPI003C2C1FB0